MKAILRLGVFISACVFLFACGDRKKDAPKTNMPEAVNFVVVQPEKAVYYDKFPGTVVPMMQVEIRPVIEGYVTGVYFKEGEHVKKGQKLYTIDDTKFMASYHQAEANVKVAESNLDQAQKDFNRYNYLNEHEAVAKQILDHAGTTLQNAKNQVVASKQDLAKAKRDLDFSTITAPFDGVIGISQVKLGNAVVAGQTVMNTISTDDPMAVDILVNEKQIPRFMKLKQKTTSAADSTFTIVLADNSVYNYPGRIQIIDRGVNPQTGAIIVRLAFPNGSSGLRAGMSCTVQVRNDDTAMQILLPGKAITEQMGEYSVFVIRDTAMPAADADKKNAGAPVAALHAFQRKVVQGQVVGDHVIIKSGIQVGDSVVTDGIQKLHNGTLVKIGTPPAAK